MSATTVAPGEARPRALEVDPDNIPLELRERAQWVLWRYELTDKGKWTKEPYRVSAPAVRASSTDPATWAPFADALAAYRAGRADGVGFVFSADDPYVGVDLDDCRGEDGTVAEWAADIVRLLDGYAEISASGRGVHVIVRGELPAGRRKGGSIEMYDQARYFAITGHVAGVGR